MASSPLQPTSRSSTTRLPASTSSPSGVTTPPSTGCSPTASVSAAPMPAWCCSVTAASDVLTSRQHNAKGAPVGAFRVCSALHLTDSLSRCRLDLKRTWHLGNLIQLRFDPGFHLDQDFLW